MPMIHTAMVVLGLWGATLPPTQASCTTGRAAACKNAPSAPGTNLAGEGFDVVTMERKQAYVIDMDIWKSTTDEGCTLCVNPYMENAAQRLPAAVVDWRPSHQCNMKVSSSVYESSEAFIKEGQTNVDASWKVGLNLVSQKAKGALTVGGTHSQAAKAVMAQSKQDKYSFITQEVHCSYYSYRLTEDPPLHPEFSRSLERLPPLYTDHTRPDYSRFLTTFGTHFIQKVRLGGRVKSLTSLRVCQASLEGYSETEVKDCLEAEASAGTHTGSVDTNAEAKYCKTDQKKRDTKESFHSTFRERITQVVGGQSDGSPDLLFSAKGNPGAFGDWLGTVKTAPDIITYELHPLHLLVTQPKKRAGLKKAVEDYILENALVLRCSDKCSGGANPSSHDACQCVCKASEQMTSQCCPKEKGLAHLTVTVERATGLWGDTTSATDGFVKVLAGTKARQTNIIYNNNNPHWNQNFDMGTVKISLGSELKLEVWDEDKHWYKWANDHLGSCTRPLKQGVHGDDMCPMNHGTLFFSYKVECAPGLGGPTCGDYVPAGMTSDLRDLYTSRHSLNVTRDFLAQLREGHAPLDPLTSRKQRIDNREVKGHPRML